MNKITPIAKEIDFLDALRHSIWFIGIAIALFSVVGKGIVAISDGYFSMFELTQFSTAVLFIVAWFCLKPQSLIVTRAVVHNSNSAS